MRPSTWENQSGHKTLDVEEHRGPSLADVICRRLEYIKRYDTTDAEVHYGVDWLINQLRDDKSHLRRIFYGTSGTSIRAALRNFRNFLQSPLLDAEHYGRPTAPSLRPSEISRAYLFGGKQNITHANIDDLFSVGRVRDIRRALLKPRVIDYVIRVRGKRSQIDDVNRFLRSFGNTNDEIGVAITELMRRSRLLLWSDHYEKICEDDLDSNHVIATSPMGAPYYKYLFGEYMYIESCLANNRDRQVSVEQVLQFSKNMIVEDERQIAEYLKKKSAADYYSVYGIEAPSITHIYWVRLDTAIRARQKQIMSSSYDPKWSSRIREYVQRLTSFSYLEGEGRA